MKKEKIISIIVAILILIAIPISVYVFFENKTIPVNSVDVDDSKDEETNDNQETDDKDLEDNTTDTEKTTEDDNKKPIDEPSTPETKPSAPETSGDKITDLINNMSIEEKVGQMFMVRCPVSNAASMVQKYHIGGYILFGRDFSGKTKQEIVANVSSYQEASSIPMLIGVDEEGGTVNRISTNTNLRSEPFKSSQELYAEGGFDLIRSDTLEKSAFLKSFGINVNFAPVVDVSTNPDDYIYKRSFGENANLTSEYTTTVVTAMKNSNIGSVLKHFPGYGNNVDTHTSIAIDNRPLESFRNSDFLPFEAGIKAGANIVLVSHNIITNIDPDNPASLSTRVHNILRNELGFNGVIITDDLAMNAISKYYDNTTVAVGAILAGNDLICTTDFETQIPEVINAINNGTISIDRINESIRRILKLKEELNLL